MCISITWWVHSKSSFSVSYNGWNETFSHIVSIWRLLLFSINWVLGACSAGSRARLTGGKQGGEERQSQCKSCVLFSEQLCASGIWHRKFKFGKDLAVRSEKCILLFKKKNKNAELWVITYHHLFVSKVEFAGCFVTCTWWCFYTRYAHLQAALNYLY